MGTPSERTWVGASEDAEKGGGGKRARVGRLVVDSQFHASLLMLNALRGVSVLLALRSRSAAGSCRSGWPALWPWSASPGSCTIGGCAASSARRRLPKVRPAAQASNRATPPPLADPVGARPCGYTTRQAQRPLDRALGVGDGGGRRRRAARVDARDGRRAPHGAPRKQPPASPDAAGPSCVPARA